MDTKKILITSYINPDLDGCAGVVAYGEFLEKIGEKIEIGIFGEPHEEAKYILNRFKIEYPKVLQNVDNFEKIILIDTSELSALEGKIPLEKVVEIIDHRKVHEAQKFPNAKAQIEQVGSVATLIAEKFMQRKIEISQNSAILLFGAIISNTLNFKGGVSTDRDRKAAEWLNEVAKLPSDFWKELFIAKSDLSGNKLIERMESDFAWFELGGKKVGIAQIEMIGAKDLVEKREEEIISELKKINKEKKLDFVFLNIMDLEDCFNLMVTFDEKTKKLIETALGLKFSENLAERESLIMRKQIVPLLKEELEK